MTERKPAGVSWETWVDRQVKEGMERGEFTNLPGAGKPIPGIDQPYDELWWVRDKLRREGVSYLPPTLELRRQRDEALAAITAAASEATVRRIVDEINQRIRHVNSHVTSGPPSTVMPLDQEAVLQRWRAQRSQS